MISGRDPLRLVFRFLLGCIAAFVFIMCALTVSVVTGFSGTAQFPVECGVVFGAAVHGTGQAGPGIYRRVQTAARLYHEGVIERLLFTGGKGSDTQESEAAVMQAVAQRMGVDANDMTLEDQSSSTIENIRNTMPLAESCSSVVGISDRYHLRRIGYLAKRLHWDALQTYPSDRVADVAFETRSILREAVALLYFGVFGLDAPGKLEIEET